MPGPREFSLMNEVKFPYKSAVDALEEVGSKDSFSLSLDLTRQGIVCGPSSGFTLQGLFQRLEKRKQDGSLSQLAGPSGEINCVFMCCDLPFQYLNEYFDNLGPEKFRPLRNEVCATLPSHCVQYWPTDHVHRGSVMLTFIATTTLGSGMPRTRCPASSRCSPPTARTPCFRCLPAALMS